MTDHTNPMAMRNWWDNPEYVLRHLSEDFASEDYALAYKALLDRTCMVFGAFNGKLRYPTKEFLAKLKSKCIVPFYRNEDLCWKCSSPNIYISWTFSKEDNTARVSWTVTDERMDPDIKTLVEEWLESVPEVEGPPAVYGFSHEHGSYVVRELGHLTDEFIRANYDDVVTKRYDHIVSELNKTEPSGRLVLVEGDPGTGKTRMIRALIGSLAKSNKCILVPPSLMDSLAGPEFVQCLISQRDRSKPLTLLLEDADDCLIAREKNAAAKASLAAVLNLSDGIMGATLNLRVIATTNQDLGDIDRAILRPGRLLERVHVGPLSATHASEVFNRLSGGETMEYMEPTILAQVYEDVRALTRA